MTLRDYQEACLDAILRRREAGVRRQLATLATGLGKSIIFANLPQYMPKDKQMMMVVHTTDLVVQGAENIAKWNPSLNIAIEMADRKADGREDIIVGSVQTLGTKTSTRLQKFNPRGFHWLVVDEVHHATSDTYGKVIDYFLDGGNANLEGFTATSQRADGKALGQVFDEIVFSYGIQEGIRDGWLVDIHGFQLHTTTDISGVGNASGEFNQTQLGSTVNTPTRNESIVKAWIEYCWPRQTVIYAVDIAHARDMCAVFVRNGIRAAYVYGTDPDRRTKLESLKKGELDVIINCQVLIEGFDYWGIEAVVLAAPSKSQSRVTQMIGRGTRLQEGLRNQKYATPEHKQNLLVVDVVDNLGRHSIVTLPSLFGLNPTMNLKGFSVSWAVEKVAAAQKEHPNLDASGLKDITQLGTYIKQADIWRVRFAEETKEYSKLQWSKRGDGSYRLLLPKEAISIREDMVGRYTVEGSVNGNPIKQSGLPDLGAAVGLAEMHISLFGKNIIKLLRNDARWRKEDISLKQREMLKKFKVPEETISRMNRGSANDFLNDRFGKKR